VALPHLRKGLEALGLEEGVLKVRRTALLPPRLRDEVRVMQGRLPEVTAPRRHLRETTTVGELETAGPVTSPRKSMAVAVRPGTLRVEENAHELGWDVQRIAHALATIGVRLRNRRVRPCDCEVCRDE